MKVSDLSDYDKGPKDETHNTARLDEVSLEESGRGKVLAP